MISADHKFAFIHVNRTGGTTIECLLATTLNINRKNKKILNFFPAPQHWTASEINKILGKDKYKIYKTFSLVRNPWDRVASIFVYGKMRNIYSGNFNNWVYESYKKHKRNDYDRMYNSCFSWLLCNNKIDIDYIGKYEQLQESYDQICNLIKIPTKLITIKKNPSNKLNYQNYYNQTSIDIINEYFKDDIETFNYRFE